MLLVLAQSLAVLVALIAAGILVLRLLNPLPPLGPRTVSAHFSDTADTPLGQGGSRASDGHEGLSGIHVLMRGHEAFAARALLARAAVRSLDVQYYIWHNDVSGTLMLKEMLDAARRGVRVRMLLDDNGIAGMDQLLSALDSHPNIEIRLFNPFVIRNPKPIGYAMDFLRLNRRMHNKSFTADNQATIIGGRNVGDEYFSASDANLFADTDVLAVGPVVNDVSSDFDRYWASQSAYPLDRIISPVAAPDLMEIGRRAARMEHSEPARRYVAAIERLPFIQQVVDGALPFHWANVRMVSDDPAKGIGRGRDDGLLVNVLREAIGEPRRELRLVSGYFVPTRAGVNGLGALAASGVDMAVFTNSFEATDVWIVHAGYAHYRKDMLKQGIRLFEMGGGRGGHDRGTRRLTTTGSGSGLNSDGGPVLRSSATTLHAKTFAVDRERLFVGSFNFDPRSMHLNTELGFLIESPPLAAELSDAFSSSIPTYAYEVVLGADGELNWIERDGDREIVHRKEPGTSRFQRGSIWLLSHLPIEWLL